MELHLQNLDYVSVAVYVALMAVIGLSFGWFIKDSGAYFKGGGTIPWVMATVTNFSGEKGNHKNDKYAPPTALIQPI